MAGITLARWLQLVVAALRDPLLPSSMPPFSSLSSASFHGIVAFACLTYGWPDLSRLLARLIDTFFGWETICLVMHPEMFSLSFGSLARDQHRSAQSWTPINTMPLHIFPFWGPFDQVAYKAASRQVVKLYGQEPHSRPDVSPYTALGSLVDYVNRSVIL